MVAPKRGNLISLLHALAGLMAMVCGYYTRGSITALEGILKPLGLAVFGVGMVLFVVSVAYLGKAFLGNVLPTTDRLVIKGPYRLVRHPLYLGMLIMVIGLAVSMRSYGGLLASILLFMPLGILRAREEEKALAAKYGDGWREYAESTHFMFPPFY